MRLFTVGALLAGFCPSPIKRNHIFLWEMCTLVPRLQLMERLQAGLLDAATHWLRSVEAHEVMPRFGLTPQFFVYAAEHLEIAPSQVLLAQGRASGDLVPVRRALTLLDQLRAKAEGADLVWLRCKTLALQALAYELLGEPSASLSILEQALSLSQPAGYRRLFVDEGQPMADLLHRLPTESVDPGYREALLDNLVRAVQRDGRQAMRQQVATVRGLPVTESLTDRELDVLRLMVAGQSNPEIARTLYVEVNTVKTHVKNLYGKLGIHSRVQAAHRAQELGLL